jgi:2',3'-cyclic-nucleotide 2'-phosphodiesterase (5'-nucleotidase family)
MKITDKNNRLWHLCVVFSLIMAFYADRALAEDTKAVPLTLIHTNDLHSHFRPERGPLGLGGVARLKTAMDRIRAEVPNSLALDGGDWSEGNIYYYDEGGVQSVKMMDQLGFDVAVVGNHDWLNGPDALLQVFETARPRVSYISANLSVDKYQRDDDFRRWVQPYVIREVGGLKVAIIGLSTYEFIYNQFLAPAEIKEPVSITRRLAAKLKQEVDVVIAVSHNSIAMNEKILKGAPDLDLIIGAHDHVKLTKPVVVQRGSNNPGWIFETGCWGRYLGRVDLEVTNKKVSLVENQKFLVQMNSSIPEDPAVLRTIENLEAKLENRFGPIFHDHIGNSEMEFSRDGMENGMGNLVTDAYRYAAHADFALESSHFMYGEIHDGPVRTVDVINAIPAIYNPIIRKAWTVKTLPMTGKRLKWILYAIYSTNTLSPEAMLSTSGLSFVYDPLFMKTETAPDPGYEMFAGVENQGELMPLPMESESIPIVKGIQIQGQPLDESREYTVALGEGLLQSFQFLNSKISHIISLAGLKDTGLENWRVLADYVQNHTPMNRSSVSIGDRVRPLKASLGLLYDDVQWKPVSRSAKGMKAEVRVAIKNFGMTPSVAGSDTDGPRVDILSNRNGTDYSQDPDFDELGDTQGIPSLGAGETKILTWEIEIPEFKGVFPVTARIDGRDAQLDQENGQTTHFFTAKSRQLQD